MTPKEYIEARKKEKPRLTISASDLPDSVQSQIKSTGRTVDEYLKEINKGDFAEYLLSLLMPRLPTQLSGLFEQDFIVVGEINEPTPNAYVKEIDNEGYAIIFNSGLKAFIYRVARILSTRFAPFGSQHHTPDIKETARLIAEVFWWFQETGQAFGPGYPIQPNQMQIASMLSLEAEKFLLAHEIGHIIDMSVNHVHPLFSELSNTLSFDFIEEHVADAFALFLAMELHNPDAERNGFLTPLVYAGIEFSIQIYRALERLGIEFDTSHPSAEQRLQFIRTQMKKRCSTKALWQDLSVLSCGIDAMFEAVINIIEDREEHEEFFNRQAMDVLSELENLLEKCTGGMVPDYSTFYSTAGEIFSRGYSHKMLEIIAHVVFDFFKDVREFEKSGNSPNQESWVLFQKFKLLFAYVDQFMPEPARSIFLQIFDSYK